MKAYINKDVVESIQDDVGQMIVDLPAALGGVPVAHLRWDSSISQVVDATTYTDFWIDVNGEKHLQDVGNCQLMTGISFSDELYYDNNQWNILTDDIVLSFARRENIKALRRHVDALMLTQNSFPDRYRQGPESENAKNRLVHEGHFTYDVISSLAFAEGTAIYKKQKTMKEVLDTLAVAGTRTLLRQVFEEAIVQAWFGDVFKKEQLVVRQIRNAALWVAGHDYLLNDSVYDRATSLFYEANGDHTSSSWLDDKNTHWSAINVGDFTIPNYPL